MATATRDVLTAFAGNLDGWTIAHSFGAIHSPNLVLFHVKGAARRSHLLSFAAAGCVGVPGGALGALFIVAQTRINAARSRWRTNATPAREVLEAALTAAGTAALFLLTARAIGCDRICGDGDCHSTTFESYADELRFWCRDEQVSRGGALLLSNGEEAVARLFSRHTHRAFGPGALALCLAAYFVAAVGAAGLAPAAGNVIPLLVLGALLGRLCGALAWKTAAASDTGAVWADPGVCISRV